MYVFLIRKGRILVTEIGKGVICQFPNIILIEIVRFILLKFVCTYTVHQNTSLVFSCW